MAPPVPFPWTAAGAPSPVHPDGPPVLRRALGGLLLAAALAFPLYGLWGQARQQASAERADQVTGTAGDTDQDGVLTVRFHPPGGGPERTARLDVWWARSPQPGEAVPLLVDGAAVRAAGDDYDLTGALTAGGLLALPGLLLLGSAATANARRSRPSFAGSAPALAVRVRADARGDLLVQPLDGPPDGPALWRLVERDRYRWARYGAPGGEGPAWVPEHLEIEDDDADHLDLEVSYDEEEEEPRGRLRPADPGAGRRLARPRRPERAGRAVPGARRAGAAAPGPPRTAGPRPALGGGRGRPRRPGPTAGPAHRGLPGAGTGRRRPDSGDGGRRPAAGPDAEPVPARRWEMPLPLRAVAGPVPALLLAGLVVLLGRSGWWGGLVHPLLTGTVAILACGRTLSWQMVVDRDGLRMATALRTRTFRWQEINAAAVHRNLLTVQLRSGEEVTVGSRPAAWLAGHFGDRYDPVELARAVATAAHRPDLRPHRSLPDRLGGPQHLLNRLSLAGYALFTIVHHLL